jgi:hypothetical protein
MNKSLFVISTVILLLLSGISINTVSSTSIKTTTNRNILYIDSSRQGNYANIQKTIDNASYDIVTKLIEQLDEDLYLDYLGGLVAFGPRVTGTQKCNDSANYIYNEFVEMGLDTRYHEWDRNGVHGKNIEATIHGTDESSDEIYIVCGHYDSVSDSPGADDDGSGTVLALSSAKIMSTYDFNHTVKFVAFSGEEQGLLGSYCYAQEAKGNNYKISAVLNADMIGFALTDDDAKYVKIYENTASHWITDFTSNISKKYKDILNLEVNPSGTSAGSDHYSFWQAGYNAIFNHEKHFNEYYHSPNDTIAHMNIPYAVRVSKLIVATLAELSGFSLNTSNAPPLTPTTPQGQTNGKINIEYTYNTSTTDPENDQIYYLFDWGDGTSSGWLGPYDSGETVENTHSWNEKGTYAVKVKAKDENDAESIWSENLTVTISEQVETKLEISIDTSYRLRFAKVSATIKNIGEQTASNVNVTLSVEYKLRHKLKGNKSIDIDNLTADGSQSIKIDSLRGFGFITIKATAYADDVEPVTDEKAGLIIGRFIFIFKKS